MDLGNFDIRATALGVYSPGAACTSFWGRAPLLFAGRFFASSGGALSLAMRASTCSRDFRSGAATRARDPESALDLGLLCCCDPRLRIDVHLHQRTVALRRALFLEYSLVFQVVRRVSAPKSS